MSEHEESGKAIEEINAIRKELEAEGLVEWTGEWRLDHDGVHLSKV
jgi:hypothetical protein